MVVVGGDGRFRVKKAVKVLKGVTERMLGK